MAILKDILGNLKHWLSKILQKVWYTKAIERRLKRKIKEHERVRVVFICHRPSVWGALKTVYEAFCKDTLFETMMVTIPQRDDNQPDGYIDEGADEYFDQYNPIRGFDKSTKRYLDIKTLKPDVVFYQQPYDAMRDSTYSSSKISKYAKICYVSYFSVFPDVCNETGVLSTCYPIDFLKRVSYFFAQNEAEASFVQDLLNKSANDTNIIVLGYPKYDDMIDHAKQTSNVWNFYDDHKYFRVLWTPRWTTNENSCHFFTYKDKWFQYCLENEHIDFVFRPHPQSWVEWSTTGELTNEQQSELRERFDVIKNMRIDEDKDYLATFYSSNCLVSDMSSMVLQYFITGKPIIYCHNPKSINSFAPQSYIGRGLYYAKSWDEVQFLLDRLAHGVDPLKQYRERVIEEKYKYNKSEKAGYRIKEAVKNSVLEL